MRISDWIQTCALPIYPSDLRGAEHQLRGRGLRHVQGDHVAAREQVVQAGRRARVAQRELGLDVVEQHVHAQRFGEHADLGADVAVADDADGLAARLVAAGRSEENTSELQSLMSNSYAVFC